MYEKKIPKNFECGIIVTMEIIGGKWKTCLINRINKGTKRPGEIHKFYKDAPLRVINRQLAELEMHGIITKDIYAQWPKKVEYNLTELGKTLLPLIAQIEQWGTIHQDIIYHSLI
ncbi:helix-turn-helix transcriptional regulator [Pedobacter sp. PAMC26386]|nr:helix-turn-helix transcriptional regulator [Pedobacter sp. PAMC26386]